MFDLLKTYYLLLLHFSLYSELTLAVLASALCLSGVSSVVTGLIESLQGFFICKN